MKRMKRLITSYIQKLLGEYIYYNFHLICKFALKFRILVTSKDFVITDDYKKTV